MTKRLYFFFRFFIRIKAPAPMAQALTASTPIHRPRLELSPVIGVAPGYQRSTRTVQEAKAPPPSAAVAYMVQTPGALPVTFPFWSTVAMLGSLLDQTMPLSAASPGLTAALRL